MAHIESSLAPEVVLTAMADGSVAYQLSRLESMRVIIRTERTKGKPIAFSDAGDWKDSQDLLEKFAKLKPQPDVNVYFTNSYLSEAPYLPKK